MNSKPMPKENKMGVMPIKSLIINMSVPMMISMLVQALYNVVDSIFVAQISENALAAVTFAFPLQNLMIAFASGTGVGINALLSKSLGEKNYRQSNAAANNGLLLTLFNYILFLLIGLFFTNAFICSQTTDPQIIAAGDTYLRIVCLFSFGQFFQITFERLLQSTGRTLLSMISQMLGAIINIIFDPIMIFGLLGFPTLGVAGAAYATVMGQIIAALVGLFLNLRFNKELHLSVSEILHPDRSIIGRIYYVGIPSILMISIGSVMTYFMNLILVGFSTTAAAVFGVYYKLQSFFFMPVFGLNNGLIPVLAFNYGARSKHRIDEALRFALCLAIGVMVCGTLVMETIPGVLLDLFQASPEMREMGIHALRTIAVHFPLAACGIVMGSIFQSLGQSFYSLVISLARQLVVLIPVAWLLSLSGNVNLVWWCFLVAEAVSMALSLFFFCRVYRKLVSPMAVRDEDPSRLPA